MRTALLSITLHLLLAAALIFTLVPMIWLLAASLKAPEDLFHYLFFAPTIDFHNFRQLFKEIPFVRYMVNSLFVSSSSVLIQVFFSSLGGFALARYDFRGKRLVIGLMLMMMMIPGQVLMAPLYELLYYLRILDTYVGLLAPWAVSIFGMFLFRQSMLQVPDELLQVGRIDGCSEFGLYWRVALPLTRPMIGAFCLIAFMGSWNSFLWPQIILQNKNRFTLPIALNQLVGLYSHQYGVLMAGTLLSILPVMIFFLWLQKEFISGLTMGALKG